MSVTLMRSRSSGPGSQVRWTLPPARLYLTALDSRFSKICLRRWRSPRTWVVHDTFGPTSTILCWSASGPIRLTDSAATSATATGSSDSDSRPASMAAMSRTSLMSASRCRAPERMWWRLSRWSSVSSSSSSSWAKPRIALRGSAARGSCATGSRSWPGWPVRRPASRRGGRALVRSAARRRVPGRVRGPRGSSWRATAISAAEICSRRSARSLTCSRRSTWRGGCRCWMTRPRRCRHGPTQT
jgi:hypothetical protein